MPGESICKFSINPPATSPHGRVKNRFPRIFWLTSTVSLLILGARTSAHAQVYRVLHDFNVESFASGGQPRASLAQAADGTLYGTTSSGSGQFYGTVFRIQPDGSGYGLVKKFTSYSQGAYPYSTLVLSGTTLFGTTTSGGATGNGTVFKVGTDGSGFAVLHSFPAISDNGNGAYTNSDGLYPYGGLVLSGTNLYGTAYGGGNLGGGTVFRIATDGNNFGVIKHFSTSTATNSDGANPYAGLSLSGATLFGTAIAGGTNHGGTVFKINTDGNGFVALRGLGGSDGSSPYGGVIVSGTNLYGAAYFGGTANGTVFKLNTNGTAFSVVWNFATVADNTQGVVTNSQGANPYGILTLNGGTLYGTTSAGGTGGVGTVFSVGVGGPPFSALRSFQSLVNATNNDGAHLLGGLVLSGTNLYGTAAFGGLEGQGTIFRASTNGATFGVIKTFAASDGQQPQPTLVLSGSALYGTAPSGGINGSGTIFKINTNGSGFSVLRHMGGNDGQSPYASLVLSGATTLFGSASEGGSHGSGTIFQLNTDGTGFQVLTNLPSLASNGAGATTNSTGSNPQTLTLAGTTLFGSMFGGGSGGGGTVFSVRNDGTGLTVLKSFPATADSGGGVYTNSDGAEPNGPLVLAGARLYGTTFSGGTNGFGVIFAVNTNGLGFTVLRHLATNDGEYPWSGLVLGGDTLYGAAVGGNDTAGTLFSIKTNGSAFTVLKAFDYGSDGIQPIGGLALSGSNLFGTTYQFGGGGTIFRLNTNGSGFTVLKSFTGADGAFSRSTPTVVGSSLYGATTSGGAAQSGVLYSLSLVAPLIASITVSGNQVTLVWSSFSNVTYRVQYESPLFPTNWTDLPGDVTANYIFASKTDTVAGTLRFYRVVALP